MTKTEQLNSLFDVWENQVSEYKGVFVKDGIINEELYLIASPKVLFVAKEPNNPKQEPGDYREWWKQEIKYRFSRTLSKWAIGILNNFPSYDDRLEQKYSAHEAIQSIAFINIKKSGGSARSNDDIVMEHLKNNFEFLHKQIAIITPEIIIAGVSTPRLRNELFPETSWVDSGYEGIKVGRYKDAKVLDFYHPSSSSAPGSFYYTLLKEIINDDVFRKM